jgi:hypothetical protein
VIETLNMGLRFVLELIALAAIGYGGFHLSDQTVLSWVLAIAPVLVAAFCWGAFRVTGDGGPPLVETPPQLRLLLEAIVFGGAVVLLWLAGQGGPALIFAVVVVIHYAIGYRRTAAFLAGQRPERRVTSAVSPRDRGGAHE